MSHGSHGQMQGEHWQLAQGPWHGGVFSGQTLLGQLLQGGVAPQGGHGSGPMLPQVPLGQTADGAAGWADGTPHVPPGQVPQTQEQVRPALPGTTPGYGHGSHGIGQGCAHGAGHGASHGAGHGAHGVGHGV